MTQARQTLGKLGEDLACEELRKRGYAILDRRYRRRGGELDIVARDGQTIVFIEVKTREGCEYGAGAESVTRLKQSRMASIALDYVSRHKLTESPCRFDVVSIDFNGDHPRVELYQNAFDVS
jgi:putative endonuclease